MADVKCGLYEINKNYRANAVRSKKCSETEPKRCWTGQYQDLCSSVQTLKACVHSGST